MVFLARQLNDSRTISLNLALACIANRDPSVLVELRDVIPCMQSAFDRTETGGL